MRILDSIRFRKSRIGDIDLFAAIPLEKISAVNFVTRLRQNYLFHLFAEVSPLCDTHQKSRVLSNLVEKMEGLKVSLSRLNRTRFLLPKNHRRFVGISRNGQQKIYEETCTFFDSYYSYMNFLKGFVAEFQKTFPHVAHASVDGFLDWVSAEFPNPIAYTYSLKPARDFRGALVHPLPNSPVHWETATNSKSEIYIIAKGLKKRGSDTAVTNVTYPEGPGWLLPAPSERHVLLFTIDLTSWLLSTLLAFTSDSRHQTRKNWRIFANKKLSKEWSDPGWLEIVISRSFPSEESISAFTRNPVFG